MPHCAFNRSARGRIIDRAISSWRRMASRNRASFSALPGLGMSRCGRQGSRELRLYGRGFVCLIDSGEPASIKMTTGRDAWWCRLSISLLSLWRSARREGATQNHFQPKVAFGAAHRTGRRTGHGEVPISERILSGHHTASIFEIVTSLSARRARNFANRSFMRSKRNSTSAISCSKASRPSVGRGCQLLSVSNN